VVGFPHDIKGQGIHAYVTLMSGEQPPEALRQELVTWVRKEIGPIASPDMIQFSSGLPKTRSGKIMRRILRKIAEDDFSDLGDTTTLADRPDRGRRSRDESAEPKERRVAFSARVSSSLQERGERSTFPKSHARGRPRPAQMAAMPP
jgi:hypothetical protein